MTRECTRTIEVAAALAAGGLDGADDELARHARQCQSCADLVLVMTTLQGERAKARREATVPAPGFVWWRAQLRRRQQAERMAAAPVNALGAVAFVTALVLLVALARWVSSAVPVQSLLALVPATPAWTAGPPLAAPAFVRYVVILVAMSSLVLAPIVVYLALRED